MKLLLLFGVIILFLMVCAAAAAVFAFWAMRSIDKEDDDYYEPLI